MSEVIENRVQLLLVGQNLENDTFDVSHLHNEGSDELSVANYVPICQKTVTYIVAAVVINNEGEVLMMQEAKVSCAGKWYLPAGRVEKDENLIDAVKREVLEETGLIIQPKTLILVECAKGSWFRFVFTGEIIGGKIKTLDQSNDESWQASWVQNVDELPLRSNDIIPLIKRGKDYMANKILQHPCLLPVVKSQSKLLLRLVITSKKRATNTLNVLASDTASFNFPVCQINPFRSLLSTLHSFMMEIFGTGVPQHKPHGLLLVEFSGDQEGDGLCLTLLVSFKLPLEDVSVAGKYMWYELSENLAENLTSRLPRNMTVPLNVVC